MVCVSNNNNKPDNKPCNCVMCRANRGEIVDAELLEQARSAAAVLNQLRMATAPQQDGVLLGIRLANNEQPIAFLGLPPYAMSLELINGKSTAVVSLPDDLIEIIEEQLPAIKKKLKKERKRLKAKKQG